MALIARPGRLRRRDLQLLAKIGLAAILRVVDQRPAGGRPARVRPSFRWWPCAPTTLTAHWACRCSGWPVGLGILLGIVAFANDPSAPLWRWLPTIAVCVSLLLGLFVR